MRGNGYYLVIRHGRTLKRRFTTYWGAAGYGIKVYGQGGYAIEWKAGD